MRNILLTTIAVASLAAATPVLAQNAGFTGVRAEVTAGTTDFGNTFNVDDLTYSGVVGVDVPLGNRFTLGAEAEVANLFEGEDEGRQVGVGARLGYALNNDVLLFGRLGYARLDDARARTLEGLSTGAGAEWRISSRTHLTAQYRFTNYNQNADSHGVLVGIGYRF